MHGLPNNLYGISGDYAETVDGRTLTEAILALAFEQRTANLIAAATAKWPNGSGMFPQVSDGMRAEILQRLGLEA